MRTGPALSLLPLVLLGIGAVVRPLRPLVLVILAAGMVSLLVRRRLAGGAAAAEDPVAGFAASPTLRAWAAAVPIAVSLTWGSPPAPEIPPNAASCSDPLSPHAMWRVGEGALVLAVLGLVAVLVRARPSSLGIRRPSRAVGLVALAGAILVGPVALFVGPALARPFFGSIPITTGDPAALLPALLFAIANGLMEELTYRGALMGWTAPGLGRRAALTGQAVIFGLAHLGPDFVGSPLPVLGAMVAGALVAGWLVRRTGSLAIPLAVHIALDIPLYYAFACRLGG